MTKKSLFHRVGVGTFHYGLGQAIPQVVRFLLIPVFTLYLTPGDFGVLGLAAALGGLVSILMRLGIPGSVTRFYFSYPDPDRLRDYLTTVSAFLFASTVLVGTGTLALTPLVVEPLMPGLALFPIVLLVVLGAAFSTHYDVQFRLIQAREQASLAARLNIARATASLILALVFVVGLRWGVTGMLLAETLASGLLLIQALVYLSGDLKGHFRITMLRQALRYGLGILPSHFVGAAVPVITRPWLAVTGSVASVGHFEFANRVARPLNMLVTSFSRAFNPVYFSTREHEDESGLRSLGGAAGQIWTLAVGAALCIGILGPPAVRMLTPEPFHVAAPIIPVLAVGFLGQVLYSLFSPEIFYRKKTYLVPVISAISAFATFGVTAFTIRSLGAIGLAWATGAGHLTGAAVSGYLVHRLVKIPLDVRRMILVGVLATLCFSLHAVLITQTDIPVLASGTGSIVLFISLMLLTGDPTLRSVVSAIARSRRADIS